MIAGGGTGGHVYPALVVAGELRDRHPEWRITFVGGRSGIENRLVPAAGFPLRTFRLAGLKGRSAGARLRGAAAAGLAVLRCLAEAVVRRPALTIGVGGYASGPAVLAAWLVRARTMILEQNHFPGATNRWLAPRVDAVCVPSPEAAECLGGRRFVTGNPVRPEFASIQDPPNGDPPTLLVFGGSRGARSINRAMIEALPLLAEHDPVPHIVHQAGEAERRQVARAYEAYPGSRHEVVPFLDDMPARLAAADLVLCRSGATTVAELAAAGRPALLVPFPHAADDHQVRNARVLERAGAAVLLPDDRLEGPWLARRIAELLADRARRIEMGRRARSLARPDAAARIARIAEALVAGSDPGAEGDDRVP